MHEKIAGVACREIVTLIGPIAMRRRWWGSRCACAPGGYHVDTSLGIDGSLSPRLQEKTCLLAADVSFRKTGEVLKSLLDITLASETIRVYCERNAAIMASWKANETDSAKSFATAKGQLEFAVDAGKVNTLEKGWRDLKIAVVQKRPTGPAATPEQWQSRELPAASARVMWADITASIALHISADGEEVFVPRNRKRLELPLIQRAASGRLVTVHATVAYALPSPNGDTPTSRRRAAARGPCASDWASDNRTTPAWAANRCPLAAPSRMPHNRLASGKGWLGPRHG